ncbi:hypothetical protein DCAR_0206882 [Daucus carota subsp. sativus]|uniref:Uncharacterized protein n=1 Tax=Daucus carota subsp. sativus TaxID=79200 RepID=A0AAF0WCY1_DAUCS|nr:hypothetical protein DCAR_0206882 [Daucus carota subsp. sativus]
MEVPESHFHDFDNDRTKESFAENQLSLGSLRRR